MYQQSSNRRVTIEAQASRPEQELHFISMTEDLEERFSPERRQKNKLDIEPWQDQQENPSESPERRGYLSRPAVYPMKIEKTLQHLKQPPTKALESNNNSNFAIRLRNVTNRSSNHDHPSLYKIESENQSRQKRTQNNWKSERGQRSQKKLRRNSLCIHPVQIREKKMTEKQYESDVSTLKTPVNMIVYPMLNQGKRRRLFKKMQKFQNFVSVALRK